MNYLTAFLPGHPLKSVSNAVEKAEAAILQLQQGTDYAQVEPLQRLSCDLLLLIEALADLQKQALQRRARYEELMQDFVKAFTDPIKRPKIKKEISSLDFNTDDQCESELTLGQSIQKIQAIKSKLDTLITGKKSIEGLRSFSPSEAPSVPGEHASYDALRGS